MASIKVKRLQHGEEHRLITLCATHGIIVVIDDRNEYRLARAAEGAVHGGGQLIDLITGDVLFEEEID